MTETTNNVGYQAMEVLYNTEGKMTPTEIGAKIGIEGFQVGRQLKDKVQQRLVDKTVEGRTSYYQITQNGRQWVEAERERIASIPSEQEEPPAGAPAAAAPAAKVEAEIEMTERDIKTLQAMVQIGEPISPTNIGELTGDLPINVGKTLKHLAKGDLARQTDKKTNLWEASDKGKACLEEPVPQQSVTGEATADVTGAVTEEVTRVTGKPKPVLTGKLTGEPKPPEPKEITGKVPSQSDLLRSIGENLGKETRQATVTADSDSQH